MITAYTESHFGKVDWWLYPIRNSAIMVEIHRSMYPNEISHYLLRFEIHWYNALCMENVSCVCVCVCVMIANERWCISYICHICKDRSQNICKRVVIPCIYLWFAFGSIIICEGSCHLVSRERLLENYNHFCSSSHNCVLNTVYPINCAHVLGFLCN